MISYIKLDIVLLYHRQRRHLHHRPLIHPPRPNHIIKHRKQHHPPRHQHAEIHTLRLHRRRNRPKAKEENNNPKRHRERIHQDAHEPRQPKRSPDELVGLAGIIVRGAEDGARAAAPEQQALGDDVGGVEAADAEGDDVVEGGRGADVDKADEAGDDGRDHDGQERDRGAGLDLYEIYQPQSVEIRVNA